MFVVVAVAACHASVPFAVVLLRRGHEHFGTRCEAGCLFILVYVLAKVAVEQMWRRDRPADLSFFVGVPRRSDHVKIAALRLHVDVVAVTLDVRLTISDLTLVVEGLIPIVVAHAVFLVAAQLMSAVTIVRIHDSGTFLSHVRCRAIAFVETASDRR